MSIFGTITKTVFAFGKENGPTICAVGSGACTVLAIVAGSKATLKASEIVEAHRDGMKSEDETERREETLKVVKELTPVYAPTVVLGVSSLVLLYASNRMHLKREAALLAAANLTEMAYKSYADKVKEIAGEETDTKVKEAVQEDFANDILKDLPAADPIDTFTYTGKGEDAVIDMWTGRKFRSSVIAIREALVTLNYRLQSEMRVTLNDLYYELGLDSIGAGEVMGWRAEDGPIEASFKSIMKGDIPYVVLDYYVRPRVIAYGDY